MKVNHVNNAHAIFGPNLDSPGGRKTKQKPSRVEPEYASIPIDFYKRYVYVTLTPHLVFVNRVAFPLTHS